MATERTKTTTKCTPISPEPGKMTAERKQRSPEGPKTNAEGPGISPGRKEKHV
ncbi:hypothetical protein [Reichenbachiella sp. MALMAid0571]|uniref:hypothetical protein n=1 Tax=Reichenbachiella sp. MALMAid0571 TaxID=3143939 RepID=UPI0032DFA248